MSVRAFYSELGVVVTDRPGPWVDVPVSTLSTKETASRPVA